MMKYLILFVLILVLSLLGFGFYLKQDAASNGELIIGIGVLLMAFVLMPLFIYHRYKDKNIKDFTFDKFKKDLEERSKSDKDFKI